MNKIYGFFNSTESFGDAEGIAIAEDGEILATHVSSCESWSAHDLGMNGHCIWNHDIYDGKYPEGWECEFVTINDNRDTHEGLQLALKNHEKRKSNVENL